MKTLIIGIVLLTSACVNLEQQHWDKFSVTHNCKIVSYTKESSITGAQFAMVGTHIVMIPGVQHIPARTEYLCTDGIKYTR